MNANTVLSWKYTPEYIKSHEQRRNNQFWRIPSAAYKLYLESVH